MGYRTKHDDPDVCVAWATILNDRDDEGVLEGFNFQVFRVLGLGFGGCEGGAGGLQLPGV